MIEIANILETIMLLCFGCSWPLSLIKNIKARSAKGMSLSFIILILSGYIAGIAAKFFIGLENVKLYVLIVYFFNLIFVSLNLVTYFRNKRLDKLNEENK